MDVAKNYGNTQAGFLNVGPKFEAEVGAFGFAISKEIEVIASTNHTWTKNKTYSNTVEDQVCYTNNTVISTSASEDFVGPDGDVYIGNTSNLVWGLADELPTGRVRLQKHQTDGR